MPVEKIESELGSIETLKEFLGPGLRAVFVGINPALVSVKAEHYFQGKLGQQFWRRLEKYGILESLPRGREDEAAFAQGFGFADVVRRPTSRSDELGCQDFAGCAEMLVQRLSVCADRPLIVFVFRKAALLAEAALRSNGYETFVMPGPYEKSERIALKMHELKSLILRRPVGRENA